HTAPARGPALAGGVVRRHRADTTCRRREETRAASRFRATCRLDLPTSAAALTGYITRAGARFPPPGRGRRDPVSTPGHAAADSRSPTWLPLSVQCIRGA